MSGAGRDGSTTQDTFPVFDHPALAELVATLGPDTFAAVWDSFRDDLERFERQLGTFEDGVSIPDIERIAHSALGCAQACHAPMLAQAARQLQHCCRNGDSQAVATLRADIIARLAETRATMAAAFAAVTNA